MKWHPFAEKFPLLEGEEFEALKTSILKTKGIDEQPILYRMVRGHRQGLDGRNRFRACRELKLPCKMKKVEVPDEEVKDFILRRNVHRRHMTRELRQQIVAELRADGHSTHVIAETLGISQGTVRNDLAAGEQFCSPETVTGKDGKNYSSTRPSSVLCGRCEREGAVEGCPWCEAERENASRPVPREAGDDTDAIEAERTRRSGQQLAYDYSPSTRATAG
jgi:hypothetical protein